MTPVELTEIQGRISRLIASLQTNSGIGFSQSFLHSDGETHSVRVDGVKSLDEFKDDLLNAIIWAWNFRDYLAAALVASGRERKVVTDLVTAHMPLRILSDLANGAKHGPLERSKSGFFARLRPVSLTIPQQAVSSMTFKAFDVSIAVSDPTKAEYSCRIESKDGRDLGDAGQLLNDAVRVWEREGLPLIDGT